MSFHSHNQTSRHVAFQLLHRSVTTTTSTVTAIRLCAKILKIIRADFSDYMRTPSVLIFCSLDCMKNCQIINVLLPAQTEFQLKTFARILYREGHSTQQCNTHYQEGLPPHRDRVNIHVKTFCPFFPRNPATWPRGTM